MFFRKAQVRRLGRAQDVLARADDVRWVDRERLQAIRRAEAVVSRAEANSTLPERVAARAVSSWQHGPDAYRTTPARGRSR